MPITMSDPSDIEPELRTPTPRALRLRTGGRLLRWFFIVLTIVAPATMTGFGYLRQQEWDALRDHGQTTTGRLTSKTPAKTGKNGHAARAVYQYEIDGTAYGLREDVYDDAKYEALQLGDPREIVYLPEEPGTSASQEKLARGDRYSTTALALWVTAGLLALIGAGFWWWVERDYGRWRRLLRDGRAVRTTSLRVEQSTQVDTGGNPDSVQLKKVWLVHYEVTIDGQPRQGKTGVDAATGQKLSPPGTQATVVYDPNEPSTFELYEAAKQTYQIDALTI